MEMKKLLLAAIGLTFTLTVNAQIINSWGIKGGINSTRYSEWYTSDSTLQRLYTKAPVSRILVNIAFFAEGLRIKYLSTVFEAAYNPKGVSFSYPARDGNGNVMWEQETDNRTGYLTLALNEKARINFKKLIFYVYGGPRADLQINSNSDINFEPTYRKFNTTIFGLSCGAGIEFTGKTFKVITEFQYEPDLSYTLNDAYGKVKKNTWMFRLGVGVYDKK
jgi:hypothetical protein